jgi:hypothetical protein
MIDVKMSKRRLKAIEAAEETCRAFRTVITKRVVDQTQADWDVVMDWLLVWMDHSPKSKYNKPKELKRKR